MICYQLLSNLRPEMFSSSISNQKPGKKIGVAYKTKMCTKLRKIGVQFSLFKEQILYSERLYFLITTHTNIFNELIGEVKIWLEDFILISCEMWRHCQEKQAPLRPLSLADPERLYAHDVTSISVVVVSKCNSFIWCIRV